MYDIMICKYHDDHAFAKKIVYAILEYKDVWVI